MERSDWHKIDQDASPVRFSDEGLAKTQVAGKEICVVKHHAELFACTLKCPHAGGDLSRGYVDSHGNIVCPLHAYKFSLQTGRNVTGEDLGIKIYPVEKRGIELYVFIEKTEPDMGKY